MSNACLEPAVSDAVLDRYAIIPAKNLSFLDEGWKGGEWVITQKDPINAKYDARVAIGLRTYRVSAAYGRWGVTQ